MWKSTLKRPHQKVIIYVFVTVSNNQKTGPTILQPVPEGYSKGPTRDNIQYPSKHAGSIEKGVLAKVVNDGMRYHVRYSGAIFVGH